MMNADLVREASQNVLDSEDCHSDSSVYEDGNETLTETTNDLVQEIQMTSTSEQEPGLPSKCPRKQPDWYGYMCLSSTVPASEGVVFSEALAGPESEQRKRAMANELLSFEDNDAWELVDIPDNVTIVNCRWVLNKKFDVDNSVRFRKLE
ncbi:unnamed protein product [Hermetia illucens]|uniref:Reverse transcriptase Ty1/copia-type domain-containing protein n=1 Tax=Hermetia illucens TaxID=343691 RepID=A0A7R8U9R0_HERIL|nr:unnamed protein product [Hermetia illucens]